MDDVILADIPNKITDAGSVRQLVENLYNGWGYNAYRKENQLRADDLLIRGKISEMLGALRNRWKIRENEWRAEKLPAPTRENPYPDPSAVATAKAMENIQKEIESFEIRIRTAPVPGNDRVWERHRNEKATLDALMQCDKQICVQLIEMMESCETVDCSKFTLAPLQVLWQNRESIL